MKLRVAITGAGGVLGSELTAKLLEKGDSVIAISSNAKLIESSHNSDSGLTYLDRKQIDRLADARIDAIIHCAFPRSESEADLASGLNYSKSIFQTANKKSCSLINVSSQSVYSQLRERAATESDAPHPESRYALAKYATELLCEASCSNIFYSQIRLASLIGPKYTQRFINYFVDHIVAGKPFNANDPKRQFGFMDVRDAASALAAIAHSDPSKWHKVYNIGPKDQGATLEAITNQVVQEGSRRGYAPIFSYRTTRNAALNSSISSELFYSDFNSPMEYPVSRTISDIYDYYEVQ